MPSIDPSLLGAHLDADAPVETIRYLGAKSKRELNAINIRTVGELVNYGVVDAFIAVRQVGHPVTLNFLWAMFAGLMDVDIHTLPREFKDAVCAELESGT